MYAKGYGVIFEYVKVTKILKSSLSLLMNIIHVAFQVGVPII